MPQIQIKSRWYPYGVVFEGEYPTVKDAVLAAIATRADLTDANLTRANLTDANLTRANLTRADLTRADLTRANLTDANLTDADLTRADLTRANLTDADLTRANLTDANLTDADLTDTKADLWMVLTLARNEALGLLSALREGKIDGSQYEGSCACLVGTIANIRHCSYAEVPGLLPNASRPSERWFLAIRPGDTPENNSVAKLTESWIVEWCDLNGIETPEEPVSA